MDRVKELTKSLLVALALSFVLRVAVVEAYWIPTGSMRPTIEEDDRVLSNKFVYWFRDPRPGEIVVFEPPPAAQAQQPRFVKRVIGVGGDVIDIRDGRVYRNGTALEEPYAAERPNYRFGPVLVPPGQLFVLGDNRNLSYDSHAWGFVPEDNVMARALATYWPLDRIGLLR